MCGISGYLDLDRGVDTDTLRRMTDVIRHRGPDDEGYALIGKEGAAFYRRTRCPSSLCPLWSREAAEPFWDWGTGG